MPGPDRHPSSAGSAGRLLALGSILGLWLTGCASGGDPAAVPGVPPDSTAATAVALGDDAFTVPPYDFAAPAARFAMPLFLKEISGITALDDRTLGAVEDETGSLYRIDMRSGEAVRSLTFGPNDDYEDIERVGDRLFVLRTDATILELVGWQTGTVELRQLFGSPAARNCDTEGLGSNGRRMLVTCKKHTGSGANEVYSVDLATARFGESPLFEVESGEGYLEGGLRPSAIAWHPVLERWVMLSAKREALVVLDTLGRVEEAWDIRPLQLEQPEGLAFMPDGDMWLSTEGKLGTGGVVRLKYGAR